MSRPSWWSILLIIFLLNGGFSPLPTAYATAAINCYATASSQDGSNLLTSVALPDGNSAATESVIGGGQPVRAIAHWPQDGGRLYAIAGDRVGRLDLAAGQFLSLGQSLGEGNGKLGLQTFDNGQGLTIDPLTGVIYASIGKSELDLLIQVNGGNGAAIPAAFAGRSGADYLPIQTPAQLGDISAIAIDPLDGQMYATASDGAVDSPSWLIRIDKNKGEVTTVGSLGLPIRGLSFTNDGALLGISSGHLHQIDKASALMSNAQPLSATPNHTSLACLTGAVNLISGVVFSDSNGNGLLDAGEAGTAGVAVGLYRDGKRGKHGEPKGSPAAQSVTDANGTFAFTVAATGDFLVYMDRKQLPRHHIWTTDNLRIIQFNGFGQSDTDNRFGHVRNDFVANEIIVRFVPSLTLTDAKELLATFGLTIKRYLEPIQAYEVLLAPGSNTDATIDLLLANPRVLYAEANYIVKGKVDPTDPDYNDPAKVYAPQLLNASVAWDVTTGSNGVIVAVIDSGVSPTHPEFSGRLLTGYDFVNSDSDPSDDQGHGTHVAGILAAAINNGQGSVGIAPAVLILPVKVLNAQNSGTWADIAAGITYAVDHGAKVLNLSLGGGAESQVLADAILYASGSGAVIVAAAGNSTSNAPTYPAYYAETIGVAATTATDQRWASSNYGTSIAVAAPGDEIWSSIWTAGGDAYGYLSGTSMAAPHVSALAALILSQNPALTSANVRTIIQQSAVDLGSAGWDEFFGYGRINVGAAVSLSQSWLPPTPTPTATPTPAPYVQRVNVGGTTFTDGQGQIWAADKAYSSGSWGYSTAGTATSSTTGVVNTSDDLLYQKQRELVGEYRFSVPNGIYNIKLKFAEFSVTKATTRAMNIVIEATSVENNFSVYGAVGKAVALDKSYTVTVNDGLLEIVFIKGSSATKNPAIAAIEVKLGVPAAPTATPTFTPTPCLTCPTATPTITPTPTSTPPPYDQMTNAGGTTFTDGLGQSWAADKAYAVGSWGYTTGSAKSYTTAVADTTDDLLYQKQRELAGEYRFTLPSGSYQVTLKFAEFSVTKATDRVMKITLESTVVESGLSVWGTVGSAKALDKVYTVTVTDGILNIIFAKASGARNAPAISAIRVRRQ